MRLAEKIAPLQQSLKRELRDLLLFLLLLKSKVQHLLPPLLCRKLGKRLANMSVLQLVLLCAPGYSAEVRQAAEKPADRHGLQPQETETKQSFPNPSPAPRKCRLCAGEQESVGEGAAHSSPQSRFRAREQESVGDASTATEQPR